MATEKQIKEFRGELVKILRNAKDSKGRRIISDADVLSISRDPNIGNYIDACDTPAGIAETYLTYW